MTDRALIRTVAELEREVARLKRAKYTHYRGTSASDFTTTTLPYHGDYGFQTTDNELQMNCGGTIRATSMAAL